jgi:hypothetical protein
MGGPYRRTTMARTAPAETVARVIRDVMEAPTSYAMYPGGRVGVSCAAPMTRDVVAEAVRPYGYVVVRVTRAGRFVSALMRPRKTALPAGGAR